ncbi:DUF58 domain-containing protein [Cryobacterium tepidiphilum]|uniref:DUF58 domain-containing protein n=1 Tax=Cryobacterium tepidiphilum TaxID=2486026 RepID=A0A3M8L184_9MICO|nr:DUF58 domain-containing protein [Cryobacterium tepidiphilum]RNE58502.1 DUF58 domain-containing protein [Cryobacterium tepidiphilum]
MPAIPRPRPWTPRFSLRGAGFLVAGAVLVGYAVLNDVSELLFVGWLLAALPLIALASAILRPVRVEVTRRFAPDIPAGGSPTRVVLTVRNLSRKPLAGTRWRDGTPPQLAAGSGGRVPVLAAAGSSRRDTVLLDYSLIPGRRGVYPVGPLLLLCTDPFGLASCERPVGGTTDLVVTPRVTALPGRRSGFAREEGDVHELLRQSNADSEELIAREYRPGDPVRRVNWPATARRGEIMVRQEEQGGSPEAVVILDTALAGRGRHEGRDEHAFEIAVELTASIGVHLIAGAFRVHVVELGTSQLAVGEPRGGTGAGVFGPPGGDRTLLEGLASVVTVTPAQGDDRWRGRGLYSSRMPAFAILVDIDEDDGAFLAALRSRYEPAVAFVLDTMAAARVDALAEAGWRCIPIRSARDIAEAWSAGQQAMFGGVDVAR